MGERNDPSCINGAAHVYGAQGILHVVDGHKGLGYGRSTPAELDFIADVVRCAYQHRQCIVWRPP
jgi:hypothetical protein